MLSWSAPRGYKGHRDGYRHAIRVKVIVPPIRGCILDRATYDDMFQWCEDNCHHCWSYVDGWFWFDKGSEAMLFKLIWGGKR